MLTKVVTGLVSSGLLLTAQAAFADHGNHYVRISEPKRECWTETRYQDVSYTERTGPAPKANPGAMILGGLLGAAIGNQFGHGHSRHEATVVGAVVGAAIGHGASVRNQPSNERVVTESRPYDAER